MRGLERGIPVLEATGLRVLELDPGRARVCMPLEPNANHIGTFYAGSLYVLAEVTGAALYSGSFDSKRYYPIVKEIRLRYRRPATTDVSAEAGLSDAEIEALRAEVDREGKADHAWRCELQDRDGQVVAVADCVFQIRPRA